MAQKSSSQRTLAWLTFLFLAGLAVLLYWPWFTSGFISYGDWWHNLPSRVVEYYRHFLIWDGGSSLGSPLGAGFGNNIIIYWVPWFYGLMLDVFHLSVSISVRIVWFIPYAVLSFWGAYYLGMIISERRLGAVIASIVYAFSTFAILGIQGGHMTIMLAYAMAPFVLGNAIRTLREGTVRPSVWLAITAALQAIYDIRISYITILASILFLLYWLIFEPTSREARIRSGVALLRAAGIALLLSVYWIMPLFWVRNSASLVPAGYDSTGWLATLSYAKLTNALAADHVWWPWSEGTQMPINPLLFVMLLLAIAGLLSWKKRRAVVYVVSTFIIGAFLVKGVNLPFSDVYVWLFQHVPGFSFFRDPAKFFTLVMLGLAPAAGIGAVTLVDMVRPKMRAVVVGVILLLLFIPQRTILFGTRHGTFNTKTMPPVYEQLASWLDTQHDWGRILWVPQYQRFVPVSQLHPVISYNAIGQAEWSSYAKESDAPKALLTHPYFPWLLSRAGVTTVGIPVDTENEIYQYLGPSTWWDTAVRQRLSVSAVTDAPEGMQLYTVNDAKPMLYFANQAVVADTRALWTGEDLPTLNDADILIEREDDGGATINNARAFLVGINADTKSRATWSFTLDQDVEGTIRVDRSFGNRSLLLDDAPLQSHVQLAKGTHTLRLALTNDDAQPAAQQDWRGCGNNEPVGESFTEGDDGSVALVPTRDNRSVCAEWELGILRAGLYSVGVSGFTADDVRATLVIDTGTGEEPTAYSIPTKDTTYYVPLEVPATHTVTARLTATSQFGDVTEGVTVSKLSVTSLLKGSPVYIAITNQGSQNSGVLPGVSATTVSPREYQAELPARSESLYLIFNQAYHPLWKLTGVDGVEHVKANGGLNAWYVPAGDAVSITIRFAVYWPYWIGIGISVVTLVGCVYVLKRKRSS